ncbi:Transcripteion factor [Dorcoceras hygrometricum]|uniref:Transcripteion factor n=1 Tax=Dorcoceras hygrometricum TaxID=472368 RepID=A0A2Z7BZW1_9LAMI|nr:Transcripteion factor [Dorcoceras hygrometricum]
MAASFSVNTLQVDFESVLAMEHSGMVDMFKALENTGLKGFLNATGSVYEAAVVVFFAYVKVIAETIAGSFDMVTNEKLDLIVAISAGLKLYELEVQNPVNEHLSNFKLDVPSINHDYLCIRFLNKELKEIARQHRNQRVLAGLPIVAPEASFAGDIANLAIPQLCFYEVHNVRRIPAYLLKRTPILPTLAHNRIIFMDSRMLSMDSKVQSMYSILGSMDSKIEQLLNVQTFLKHDFGTHKRALYYKMDTVAGNVKSSQTSLETTVLHHLTEHQPQMVSDLDYVKLQLAELVNHLKELGDAKKGEDGRSCSRPGEGSGRQGEGPIITKAIGCIDMIRSWFDQLLTAMVMCPSTTSFWISVDDQQLVARAFSCW